MDRLAGCADQEHRKALMAMAGKNEQTNVVIKISL